MPNLKWSQLTALQLGRYAEYYAKMEFSSYGYEIYSSEVDDHGVDFVVKVPGTDRFYEVQVKSIRNFNFVSILKSKMQNLTDSRLVCFLRFTEDNMPEIFIIPASAWREPNAVFVARDYGKPGQTSKPEWGISISKKNYHLLAPYKAEIQLKEMLLKKQGFL